MKYKKEKSLVPQEFIEQRIYLIRGRKVMLDSDLAILYGVETKNLNKSVSRNTERFPEDFMFQLNAEEFGNLRFQFGTSSYGGRRYLPYAFTEQGVAMLSGVLNSEKAIEVNVQIIRTFVRLREMIISNKQLHKKIEDMESKYDKRFKVIFDTLRELIENKKEIKIKKQDRIGFKTDRKIK